jgi:hypothetical protein
MISKHATPTLRMGFNYVAEVRRAFANKVGHTIVSLFVTNVGHIAIPPPTHRSPTGFGYASVASTSRNETALADTFPFIPSLSLKSLNLKHPHVPNSKTLQYSGSEIPA